MRALRDAFEAWVRELDLEALTFGENELLHTLNTVAQRESVKEWYRTRRIAAKEEK